MRPSDCPSSGRFSLISKSCLPPAPVCLWVSTWMNLIAEHPLLTHRVKAFGDRLPFRNSSFDIITANMVMEHVQDPEAFLREVKRVLRPHGMFLFHTPNYHYYGIRVASLIPDGLKQKIIWILEKRHAEDVFPTFYRINTLRDIQIMASNTGFAVERLDIAKNHTRCLGCWVLRASSKSWG